MEGVTEPVRETDTQELKLDVSDFSGVVEATTELLGELVTLLRELCVWQLV